MEVINNLFVLSGNFPFVLLHIRVFFYSTVGNNSDCFRFFIVSLLKM